MVADWKVGDYMEHAEKVQQYEERIEDLDAMVGAHEEMTSYPVMVDDKKASELYRELGRAATVADAIQNDAADALREMYEAVMDDFNGEERSPEPPKTEFVEELAETYSETARRHEEIDTRIQDQREQLEEIADTDLEDMF